MRHTSAQTALEILQTPWNMHYKFIINSKYEYKNLAVYNAF